MSILPDAPTSPGQIDLSHLVVSHVHGRDGERVQVRDWKADAFLVATLTPEAAATFSLCLDRAVPGVVEFADRMDQAVAGAVYATVARVQTGEVA